MAKSRHRPPVLTEEELATERWAPIPEAEGRYEVSDLGRIRRAVGGKNTRAGRILRHGKGGHGVGYAIINVTVPDKKTRYLYVHRLVATAFGAPGSGREVNHINGNRWDNRLHNLEFVSHRQNMQHSTDNGLHPSGEQAATAVLTMADVLDIRMRRESGDSYVDIGRTYGITPTAARFAAIGRTWKMAPGPIAPFRVSPTRGGNRILVADDIQRIRALITEGLSDVDIARRFGVHANTISQVATGRNWSHIA